MDLNLPQTELTLDYKVPVVVADNSLVITKNGQFELAFLQFNQLNQPTAQVVASVRLANVEALRDLKRAIEEHLDKEDKKEK
jgi:hypothetical protein